MKIFFTLKKKIIQHRLFHVSFISKADQKLVRLILW